MFGRAAVPREEAGVVSAINRRNTKVRSANETFCQRVVAAAGIRSDKVAMMVIGPDGTESITFGSMLAQIRSIAYRLSQEKIAFGDRVALIGENHPNWAIAYLGIIYRGAVVTPMDPAATITGTRRLSQRF